ncbi:hypothetical protein ACHAPT_011083 [Fusarium lateritium]
MSPVERDKAQASFYDIIHHFESSPSSSSNKEPYDRTKPVRLTYEYSRSDDPRCPFLQEFLRFVDIAIDESIDFDNETVVDKIRSGMSSFADFLVDNFFLPLKDTARQILDMFDPGIVSLIDGVEIDRPFNALTLEMDLHQDFGNFEVFFEPRPGPHTYRIDSTLDQALAHPVFPVTRQLFPTPERTIDPPHPRLLAIHRAICRILQLSATGKYIDHILDDMDDGAVEADGSTHLASLARLKLDGWWDGTVMG